MNNIRPSTLRPGLLVSLKSGVRGNVSYFRKEIELPHTSRDGKELSRWETERVIEDPVEYKAADKVATSAGALVRKVCAWSAFGLLCPNNKVDELNKAVTAARTMAETFNSTAKLTRVNIYVMLGQIADNDAEATRAINSEMRQLVEDMQSGIQNVDVKKIRDAAYRAKQLGAMLTPAASDKIKEAIEVARAAARKIVKVGEAAAQTIDRGAINALTQARTAFLDLDQEEREVAAPRAQARILDLEDGPATKNSGGGSTRKIPRPKTTRPKSKRLEVKKARKEVRDAV